MSFSELFVGALVKGAIVALGLWIVVILALWVHDYRKESLW